MSQPIVPSITDDQLDELEEICRQQGFECCRNFSVGGEYMGAQEMVCCMEPRSTERDISWPAESILELVTRLRAAEKDAARYRWLRSADEVPFNLMSIMIIDEKFDQAVDAAMEQQP